MTNNQKYTQKILKQRHQRALAATIKAIQRLCETITLLSLSLSQSPSTNTPDKKTITSAAKRISLNGGRIDKRTLQDLGILPPKRTPRPSRRTKKDSFIKNIRTLQETIVKKKEEGTLTALDVAMVETLVEYFGDSTKTLTESLDN
jgi:hypothetical protein